MIWGGEFGRGVAGQGNWKSAEAGRDHHPRCFTMFLAGGQTALVAATNKPRFTPADPAVSARPDAVVLVYPWKIVGPDNKGLRADVTIDATTPPMFIAQASNDPASVPQGAINLYLACLEAKVPAEIHVYEGGGHGFGMRPRDNAPGTADWPNRALDWLRTHW